MSRLGLKPDQCIIVEDNEHGIRAAKPAARAFSSSAIPTM
jgi:beta-phosphoglucomutase-like phosphatase (HAD superfamily)